MRCLLVPLLALPLGSDLMSQSPTRKSSEQASQSTEADEKAPRRQGGYFGLTLTEDHRGKTVDLHIAVFPGSEAERLGFKTGDIVRAVDGKTVAQGDDFIQKLYNTMSDANGGDALPKDHYITVQRGYESIDIKAGLDDLDAKPSVGDKAPDFTLLDAAGEEEVTFSDLMGDKPVFLVFGSYT